MTIDEFFKVNEKELLLYLTEVVDSLKSQIRANPSDYLEYGTDTPSIDIRLCIDPIGQNYQYLIKTGDSSYDQRHSLYCAASVIDIERSPHELYRELVDEILNQSAMYKNLLID